MEALHTPTDRSAAHHMSIVTAQQTAHLGTHYPASLYQPALNTPDPSLPVPPTTLRTQSDIHQPKDPSATPSSSSPAPTKRQALGETSHNAHQTPPITQYTSDSEDYLKVKAKLAEKKKNRTSRAVRNVSGGSIRRISDSNTILEPTQDLMPYRQYRARQRREATNGRSASVWDEELEAAFMEAIKKIPKIGRRKLAVEGKQRGRNELIAEYIYKVTGVKRCRKQVSSHIQVLKNLLRNNPEFMKHVTTDKETSNWEAESNSWDIEGGSPSSYSEPTPCMDNGHLPSTHRPSTSDNIYDNGFVSPPPSASQSNFQFSTPGFEITTFEMSVGTSNDIEGCFHKYTSLAQQESMHQIAISLDVLPAWKTRFPHVAELVENGDLSSNCTMLHASTSISLMSTGPPSNALLRTRFELSLPSSAALDNRTWECVTRIYAPGKKVWELSHPVPQTIELDGACKLTLPFASDFWSVFYTGLSAAHQQQSGDGQDLLRRREKEARDAIKGITVVQELFSTSLEGLGVRERSAMLLWEFTKAGGNLPGKAVWREITPYTSSPSMVSHHALPITSVSSIDDGELISAAKAEHGSWQNQYQPHIPMSPYEELSPTMGPYYNFDSNIDSNSSNAFTSAGTTANVSALLAADMSMEYFSQQQHHGHPQQGSSYAPFIPSIGGLTGASRHAEVEQFLGVGTGAGGGGDNWPQQAQHHNQHLSPVSEAQDGYVELGF